MNENAFLWSEVSHVKEHVIGRDVVDWNGCTFLIGHACRELEAVDRGDSDVFCPHSRRHADDYFVSFLETRNKKILYIKGLRTK